ncbi:MAG: hypothetical protein JSR58_07025 [Verrucomicrobia bacterium]|nr:hypothetical protein [Verrucomicrobiota bacterium]
MAFQLSHVCKSLAYLGQKYELWPVYALNHFAQIDLLILKKSSPEQFDRIQKINSLLFLGNIGFFLWSAGKLLHIASERFSFIKLADIQWGVKAPFRFELAILGTIIAWTVITSFIVSRIQKKASPPAPPPSPQKTVNDHHNIKLSWARPFSVCFAQGIHISQMCVNIALACFGVNPIFYSISTLVEGVRLHKASKISWVQFERHYPDPKIDFIFGFALLSSTDKFSTCPNHSHTLPEIIDHIYAKTSSINFTIEKAKKNLSHRNFASPDSLPTCPDCTSPLPGSYHIASAKNQKT